MITMMETQAQQPIPGNSPSPQDILSFSGEPSSEMDYQRTIQVS